MYANKVDEFVLDCVRTRISNYMTRNYTVSQIRKRKKDGTRFGLIEEIYKGLNLKISDDYEHYVGNAIDIEISMY